MWMKQLGDYSKSGAARRLAQALRMTRAIILLVPKMLPVATCWMSHDYPKHFNCLINATVYNGMVAYSHCGHQSDRYENAGAMNNRFIVRPILI